MTNEREKGRKHIITGIARMDYVFPAQIKCKRIGYICRLRVDVSYCCPSDAPFIVPGQIGVRMMRAVRERGVRGKRTALLHSATVERKCLAEMQSHGVIGTT